MAESAEALEVGEAQSVTVVTELATLPGNVRRLIVVSPHSRAFKIISINFSSPGRSGGGGVGGGYGSGGGGQKCYKCNRFGHFAREVSSQISSSSCWE